MTINLPVNTVAPPQKACVMRHNWADLLFLHWEVPAGDLQRLIPHELAIDTFEGKAYIALVPFRITCISAGALKPTVGVFGFPEINVRTYVRRNGSDPGVWFFSLDAADALACLGARLTYKLPYFFAEIEQTDSVVSGSTTTHYVSRRYFPGPVPAFADLEYAVCDEAPASAAPGSLEEFLIERYLLYSYKDSSVFAGWVRHTPYQIQPAVLHSLEENLVSAAGVRRPESSPLIHFARLADVKVFPLKRL